MKSHHCFSLAILLFVWISCQTRSSSNIEAHSTSEAKIVLPDFDADSAYHFVAKQVAFGPRVPGTRAHEQCANWLQQTISAYADEVVVQPFSARVWNGEIRHGKNIIALFSPEKKSRILLGAHWDSRPTADQDPDPNNWHKPVPGANDGASGVGVLLEVARQLSINRPNVGVDIIFFDLEDYGTPDFADVSFHRNQDTWALGAQHWAQNPHKFNYRANYGILLDMVGAANPRFAKEGFSMYFASDIVNKVWKTAQALGFGYAFVNERGGDILDDHYYVNTLARIPMINIIHHDRKTASRFFPQWHTIHDDLSIIDKNTLLIVGQTVLAQIYQE
ncbi:MAG: M28 family peptidase [Bacteroidales bacterium]|jgi:Zn-dependent M28 family amino/carboxypeptidase|nr:M28 family peptidase [Bacteroidales bacterium]